MSLVDTKNPVVPIKAPLPGGGLVRAIVPQDFESAYRLANVVVSASMAPKSLNTVEKATVAILHGLEVGLTPMAALQSIAIVNGMPTIYGDAMLALINNSGLLEDMEEHVEVDEKGEVQYATCTMKRVGRATPVTTMFTRVQAMRAGLLTKEGPWKQYPDRMFKFRARGYTCRDLFPDVLRGLHQTEEMMDMVDITSHATATTTAAPEPRKADFQPPAQQQQQQPAEPEPETWELFDEVGELVGAFEVGEWITNLGRMADGKITAKERAQLLENNHETGLKMKADGKLTDEGEEILAEIYAPPAEPEQKPTTTDVKDWSIPDNIVGQEPKLAAIYKLLDEKTETPQDVEDLWATHEAFFAKFGSIKKAAANQRFGNRKIELAQKQAAE